MHHWNTIHDIWKITTTLKKSNSERQVMTMYETELTDKQERTEKYHIVSNHTVTILPYYISIVQFNTNKQHRKYTNKHTTRERKESLPFH